MDDLGKLLLFRDVVDAGGFSHAAKRRGLSHSTVSKHIRSLEEDLDVLLLNRTSRSMSLTEAGTLALAHCRRIGGEVERLREGLDELRGDVVGALRINSLVHVGKHLVQAALKRYLAEFPRARAELVLDDGPLHFNRDGFDVAVRVGLQVESSLTAVKLIDNDVCIVAAPSLLKRHRPPSHPSELRRMPCVGYQSAQFDITAWAYVEDGVVKAVEVDPICRANDGNALLDLTLDGIGVGYLSTFAAREHLRRGDLVQLLPMVELPAFDPVYVVQASSEHASLKVETFKRHLRSVAQDAIGS